MSIFIRDNNKVDRVFASVPFAEISKVNLFGKSKQESTPTPESPQEIEISGGNGIVVIKSYGKNVAGETMDASHTTDGVTFTVNEDKSVTMNGKSTGRPQVHYNFEPKFTGMVILTGSDSDDWFIYPWDYKGNSRPYTDETKNGLQTLNQNKTYKEVRFFVEKGKSYCISVRVEQGRTFNNITAYPLLRRLDEKGNPIGDATYEPYKESTAEIITKNGFVGIPSESGGNYTDENGQQWVCDEIIKYADGTGKKIQKIKKIVFDGVNLKVDSTTGTAENNVFFAQGKTPDYKVDTSKNLPNILSSHFIRKSTADGYWKTEPCIYQGTTPNIYMNFGVDVGVTTVDQANEWLKSNNVTVYYELATPITTALTAEEIAAIEKLQAFHPITNIYTDEDCGLNVSIDTRWEKKEITSMWVKDTTAPTKVFSNGLNKFVCVGENGYINCSNNGKTWNAISSVTKSINSVTFGNDRFVCVGDSGKSYYSLDGVTWNAMGNSGTRDLQQVIYGNGIFVAVNEFSGHNVLYYSKDGENWTAGGSDKFSGVPEDIVFGNGRFVAVGKSGKSYYSLDGQIWTAMSGLDSSSGFYGVTYGNGRFVTVGDNCQVYYSTDGETWMKANGPGKTVRAYSIVYGKDRFVIVGEQGYSYYSFDCETWVYMSGLSTSTTMKSVIYGNNKFVTVGDNGTSYYSSDWETWNAMSGLDQVLISDVCFSADGGYKNT